MTKLLADEGINIRALSLADMPDLGVLRLIVNDRGRCLRALKDHGFVVQETDVIAVEIEDKPGGLNRIVEVLDRENINIEYMYAFVTEEGDNAIVVLKIDDAARAAETLREERNRHPAGGCDSESVTSCGLKGRLNMERQLRALSVLAVGWPRGSRGSGQPKPVGLRKGS